MNYCSDVSLIRITVLVFIILFIFGLLTYNELLKFSRIDDGNTLVLLHVIFRNGKYVFQDDLKILSEEIPCTSCKLLKEGRKEMFDLGLELRKQYFNFIDRDDPNTIFEAIHSDTSVSKNSLIFLLAGFTQSEGRRNKWLSKENLQHISPKAVHLSDPLLSFKPNLCPRWNQLYNNMLVREDYSTVLNENARYFEYISKKMMKPANPFSAFMINYNMESGAKPPEWVHKIYPQPTKSIVNAYYKLLTANDEMKKILAGPLLSKIINDTSNKISKTSTAGKKIHLYSAEEYNLQYLLRTIGVNEDEITTGSYIAIEVHLLEGNHFIKIYFRKSIEDETKVLDLPYCGKLCPFSFFMERNKKLLPMSDMCSI